MIFDPNIEGSCLLYDGAKQEIIMGEELISQSDTPQPNSIGYLAYPNPNFKNTIPDRLFYCFKTVKRSKKKLPTTQNTFSTSGKLKQSVTKAQYLQKIATIHELLAAGEVYQVNYAIRFTKQFSGSPYALFHKLAQVNPASFAAYMNCGNFHLISASPERLFCVKNRRILTEPIKGTVTKKGGKRSLARLLASEKERAELDMITDLSRNDIGKVCEYGTLKLKKERAIMELPNLWHTYSQVEGRLTPQTTPEDIIAALFPGGSITGCPKIRSMEYIEQLENLPRNIYTGSIGYQDSKGNMDFNIAIRTILIQNGQLEFWAGGGIVADSNPENEYAECMLKAEKFLSLF